MIELVIQTIIRDLGPTGLLVVGLYFIAGQYLKKISTHLYTINHELGEIRDLLKNQANSNKQ